MKYKSLPIFDPSDQPNRTKLLRFKNAMSRIHEMEEQVQMELGIHLEEYKAKMQDISAETSALHQTFALTVTVIGFILAAAPFIIQFYVAYVFAAASFVFYGLALTQLRHAWAILAVEAYIAEILKPNIQETLLAISPQSRRQSGKILLWSSFHSRFAYTSLWWQFPIEFARYLIPVGAGIACCIAYWFTPAQRIWFLEAGIVISNALVVLYVFSAGLAMRSRFLKDKSKMKKMASLLSASK